MRTYRDPAYRRLGQPPTKSFLGWDLVDLMDDSDRHDPGGPRMTIHLLQAYPAKNKPGALPATDDLLKANFEEALPRAATPATRPHEDRII